MSEQERRERREQRQRESTARAMANAPRGFVTTTLRVPSGMEFFQPDEGVYTVDIVPFIAKAGNPNARPGQLHFERTFYTYRDIGIDPKSYVALAKTFGKRDPIQEARAELARNPDTKKETLKALDPKDRQVFLVYDHKDKAKGLKVWEFSYFNFGDLLLERIQKSALEKGWDLFYYPDEDGMTLELTFSKKAGAVGKPYLYVSAIDFNKRTEPLPDAIVNHGLCLDDFILETPYETLRKIYHGIPLTDDEKTTSGSTATAKADEEKPKESPKSEEKPKSDEKRREEPSAEERAKMEKDVYEMGYLAYQNGRHRKQNPYDEGTRRYELWREGWMDAFDKEPAPKKEDEKPQAKPETTAASLGIERKSTVMYKGEKHDVLRISEDGKLLNLMDESGENVSRDVSVLDVQVIGSGTTTSTKVEEKPKETPKAEDKPAPKAEEKPKETPKSEGSGGVDKSWDNW